MTFGILALLACGTHDDDDRPDYSALGTPPDQIQFEMVSVPTGQIVVQKHVGEGWGPGALDRSMQITQAYEIGTTEITCEQWISVMGVTEGLDTEDELECGHPLRPIRNVSWMDAIRFCNALSEQKGLTPVYTIGEATGPEASPEVSWNPEANGYRLPTGVEWEYAARSGSDTSEHAACEDLVTDSWFSQNTQHCMPVAQKKPNALGLYDICGNVREWTWDKKNDHDQEYNQGRRIMKDFGDEDRQARGGGYLNERNSLRVGNLYWYHPNYHNNDTGFRIARSLEGSHL